MLGWLTRPKEVQRQKWMNCSNKTPSHLHSAALIATASGGGFVKGSTKSHVSIPPFVPVSAKVRRIIETRKKIGEKVKADRP